MIKIENENFTYEFWAADIPTVKSSKKMAKVRI